MAKSAVKVEIRFFKTKEARDAYWETDGTDLLADPRDYGFSENAYALTEGQLRHIVKGRNPDTISYTKILGRTGVDEHEACHTQDLEIACGWYYNP